MYMQVCVYVYVRNAYVCVNTYSFELISLPRQTSYNVYGYFVHASEVLNCVLA